MPGVRGRSGGANKIAVQVHLAKGTYRPGRHAAALAKLALVPAPAAEPPPAHVLEGLGERGKAFVLECWDRYGGWGPAQLALLHEAGQVLDALPGLRGSRGERAAQREFRSLVVALHFEE